MDFGLTELGALQAKVTAERLAREEIHRIVSSPLRRAADTAVAISEGTGVTIEFADGLREYDIGAASGLTAAEIRERFPDVAEGRRPRGRPPSPGAPGRGAWGATGGPRPGCGGGWSPRAPASP